MVLDKFCLSGKSAIVTGAGHGLGKYISLALAEAGVDVLLAGRTIDSLEKTASEVEGYTRKAVIVQTDVTKEEQVEYMVNEAISKFGMVDILVNNAGGLSLAPGMPNTMNHEVRNLQNIENVTTDYWQSHFDQNMTGAMMCTRAVVKHMLSQNKGKIINITSVMGIRTLRGLLVYSTAKAALAHFTRTLSAELAPFGININAIAPAAMQQYPPKSQEEAKVREDVARSLVPLGYNGTGRELGPLAVFLASEASDYMTGTVIVIDGGSLAGGYTPAGYAPVIHAESHWYRSGMSR